MTWARNTLIIRSWWTGRPWKVNINKQATNQSSSPCFVPWPVSLSELFQKELVVLDMTVPGFTAVNGWLLFCLSFSKWNPKKGKSILHQRDHLPPGQTQRLLWPQGDACCLLSLDQWVNLCGKARRRELGESFWSRKGIFGRIFQKHDKLSRSCDLRLPHKLIWGTLWLVQWWSILFPNPYSQVLLTEPSTFSKSCKSHQWNCFVDEK